MRPGRMSIFFVPIQHHYYILDNRMNFFFALFSLVLGPMPGSAPENIDDLALRCKCLGLIRPVTGFSRCQRFLAAMACPFPFYRVVDFRGGSNCTSLNIDVMVV
jgi:hypothetical protein